MDDEYISLYVLAARLKLPRPFLRDCARRGSVPSLTVGGRLRFDEMAVREALREMAQGRADGLRQAEATP